MHHNKGFLQEIRKNIDIFRKNMHYQSNARHLILGVENTDMSKVMLIAVVVPLIAYSCCVFENNSKISFFASRECVVASYIGKCI